MIRVPPKHDTLCHSRLARTYLEMCRIFILPGCPKYNQGIICIILLKNWPCSLGIDNSPVREIEPFQIR
jgi:hypothetical protein